MRVRLHVFVFTLCIACYTVSIKDHKEATSPSPQNTHTTAGKELPDRSEKVKNTQNRIICAPVR